MNATPYRLVTQLSTMSNQTYQHAAAIMAGENPSFAASPPKLKSPTASSSFSRTEQFNPDTASPSSPTEVEMEPVRRGDRVVSMFYQRDGETPCHLPPCRLCKNSMMDRIGMSMALSCPPAHVI